MKRNIFSLFFPRQIFAALVLALLVFPQWAHAFTANYLLSDTDLTDSTSMSKAGIADFLRSQGGDIAKQSFDTPNAKRSAADILYSAAAFYRISPKVLMTVLQKEQSLITAKKPSSDQYAWATGFGVCDSCSKDDPAIAKYKGLYNQVNWTAKRFRESYLADLESKGTTISGWGPSITKTIPCLSYEATAGLCSGSTVSVTPQNKATAMLYTYTPHLQGNANFVRLWNTWFFRQFPDGSLLVDGTTKTYYLIDAGTKRKFASLNVVVSESNPSKAIQTNAAELALYPDGAPLTFPNYSLVKTPSGVIYLLVDNTRRRVVSPEVFRTLGFNPEEVIKGSEADIAAYPDGQAITLESAYSAGALLQSATNGGIVYVESGVRHAIYSKEILVSRFAGQKPQRVTEEELQQYAQGDPVLFKDGELISAPTDRSVYFVSHGTKRPITSRDTFDRLGFKWANIVVTNQRSLDILPTGDPLSLDATATSTTQK